jgi:hypothetical protein
MGYPFLIKAAEKAHLLRSSWSIGVRDFKRITPLLHHSSAGTFHDSDGNLQQGLFERLIAFINILLSRIFATARISP